MLELHADIPSAGIFNGQQPARSLCITLVQPALAVELAAQLPAGMKFVRANNAGYYDEKTHRVLWSLEELPQEKRVSWSCCHADRTWPTNRRCGCPKPCRPCRSSHTLSRSKVLHHWHWKLPTVKTQSRSMVLQNMLSGLKIRGRKQPPMLPCRQNCLVTSSRGGTWSCSL